jgi:choline-phosphate cytidylyltransferase
LAAVGRTGVHVVNFFCSLARRHLGNLAANTTLTPLLRLLWHLIHWTLHSSANFSSPFPIPFSSYFATCTALRVLRFVSCFTRYLRFFISPSTTSVPMAPKRKRANTLTRTSSEADTSAPAPMQQASSRDASEEDTADPILQEVASTKQPQSEDAPAPKRSRASLSDKNKEEHDESLNGLLARKSSEERRNIEYVLEHGEGGERGNRGMSDPPKAGLVDPVGYKTNPPPEGRAVRIYADGVFDLFHLGHMRQLQQAKLAFPDVYLIVGVTGDKETHRRKGLTVLSAKERAESVRNCKWVDEVVEDCPWIIADAPEFMEKYKIDYVAHDDIPYGADEGDDIYSPIKQAGKFLVTQRTDGVSTTGIITKIVKDYDAYIARQFQRGTTRQELNVSWLKKNELDIKRAVTEMRETIKHNWSTTGQELGRELRTFWQPSRPSSPAPSHRELRRDGHVSPTSSVHGPRLEAPKSPNPNSNSDFAAGYSLGLIGGVRSWVSIHPKSG